MKISYKNFAKAYARHGNSSRAAIEAGYGDKNARNQGWRLLQNDDIRKLIEEEKKRLSGDFLIGAEGIISEIGKLAIDAECEGLRFKALIELAKMKGLYKNDDSDTKDKTVNNFSSISIVNYVLSIPRDQISKEIERWKEINKLPC